MMMTRTHIYIDPVLNTSYISRLWSVVIYACAHQRINFQLIINYYIYIYSNYYNWCCLHADY